MHVKWRVCAGLVCLTLGPTTTLAQTAQNANAPVAPAPGGSPAMAPVPSSAPATPPDASALKLREIEERINQLKEKVFQSKARLVQLQEVVLHGTIAGSNLVLQHKNEMGSSFRLARLQYALDGVIVYNRTASEVPDLDKQAAIEVFNGPVAPGSHQLSALVEYEGNGFGLFNYLEGYKFRVRAGETFQAEEGQVTVVRAVGYERGNFTTELKDRPAMRFEIDATTPIRPPTPESSGSDAEQSSAPSSPGAASSSLPAATPPASAAPTPPGNAPDSSAAPTPQALPNNPPHAP